MIDWLKLRNAGLSTLPNVQTLGGPQNFTFIHKFLPVTWPPPEVDPQTVLAISKQISVTNFMTYGQTTLFPAPQLNLGLAINLHISSWNYMHQNMTKWICNDTLLVTLVASTLRERIKPSCTYETSFCKYVTMRFHPQKYRISRHLTVFADKQELCMKYKIASAEAMYHLFTYAQLLPSQTALRWSSWM